MITLTSGVQAAISSRVYDVKRLVRVDMPTPFYLTDHFQNISFDSKTWISSPHMLEVGPIKQSGLKKNNRVTFRMSGVDQAYYSLFLLNPYMNRRVYIYLAFFDDAGQMQTPLLIHDGKIVDVAFEDNIREQLADVSITVGGPFDDFDKKAGRRTNTESQKEYFPSDKGLQYSGQAAKADLKWGV
jgi:hypothetical protein